LRPSPEKPFITDGCSGFMSFLFRVFLRKAPPWEGGCVEHDRAYWAGGPTYLRLEADSRLMQYVAANGHPWWAAAMFIGVRIGGVSWIPFPSVRQVEGKWTFAWDYVRWGYRYKWPKYKED
jgi:hypothetical protein